MSPLIGPPDAHRLRQQAAHPGLTITDMYNVLGKLRRGEPLTAKDKKVHEQGLVSVLRHCMTTWTPPSPPPTALRAAPGHYAQDTRSQQKDAVGHYAQEW